MIFSDKEHIAVTSDEQMNIRVINIWHPSRLKQSLQVIL